MRKRIFPLLILLVLLVVQPLCAAAVSPLETSRTCTLKVHYAKDEYRFADVQTLIYRVAEANADGSFDLIAPFSNFGVNIHGIQSRQEWKDLATTMVSHIVDRKIQPNFTALSDENGTSAFMSLNTGLYLVLGTTTENDTGIYTFEDFFVYLPTPNSDGSFSYDMEVRPKPGAFTPKTEYTVKKLWKDSGYTASRPESVTVAIYKDTELYDTVVLNADNNWSYSWKTPEDSSKWSVAEKDVPDKYTVTVNTNDNVFSITNSIQTTPGSVPKTGDTFPLWQYMITLCLSGFLLLCMGILFRRKRA